MTTIQKLIAERKQKEKKRPKALTKEKLEEQVTDWCDFYRKNWDIYARYELGMESLRTFQEYILYEMGISNYFFLMCSRGSSKSFLTATGAFITCMLYPKSTVVITATTKATAKKMINNKMKNELCGSFSPKLKYLYDNGYIKFKDTDEETSVTFTFNGSKILLLAEVEASAGERATMLIFEEVRMSKAYFVNRIFMPMKYARPAEYRLKDKYKDDKRLIEKAKIVYLTSTSYTFEWWFEKWKAIVAGFFNTRSKLRYGIFACDIFTSIYHGFTTQEEFDAVQDDNTVSDVEIKMEYYNEPQGDLDGSFYSMEKIKECSILEEPFIPPTYEEFIIDYDSDVKNLFREKTKNETRIIYVDFASSDTVKKGQDNDLTVIGCMSGIFDEKKKHMYRNDDHIETMSGGMREESIKRIRELFYFYQADAFVYDNQQVGGDRFIELSKPYHHPELGIDMHGFGIYQDKYITDAFCDNAKVENLKTKVIDINGSMPVAVPVVGNADRNQDFHVAMQNAIKKKLILFLCDKIKIRSKLEESPEWFMKSSEYKKRRLIGHLNTEFMATEAVELRQEIKNNKIILSEIPHHTKDRIIATVYGNYFFNVLEQKILKNENNNDEITDDELDELFG